MDEKKVVAEYEQPRFTVTPLENNVIERAMKGDKEAFEKLFMGTYRYVFSVVRGYLKNDQDAYDAIQETYTRVYKGLSRLESVDSFYPWLHRISENCSLDVLKQSGLDLMTEMKEEPRTEDKSRQSDVTSDVTEVLKQLPAEQVELLVRVYYDGMKVSELAKMQGIPKTTVYNRLNVAKKRLKELLRIRGIDKPIYGGEFLSILSAALRNAIGTELLSMAVAEEILHNVMNSTEKKGAVLLSQFARKMRNRAAKKIAAILLLICVALVFISALLFAVFWNLFGPASKASSESNSRGQSETASDVIENTDKDGESQQNNADNNQNEEQLASPSSGGNSISSGGTSASKPTGTESKPSGTTPPATPADPEDQTPPSQPSDSTTSAESTPSQPSEKQIEFQYRYISDGCVSITGVEGDPGDSLTIPSKIDVINGKYRVIMIEDLAGCEKVKTLELPGSITFIDPFSLRYCEEMEKISFYEANSVYSIKGNCLINTEEKALVRAIKTSVIPDDGSVTTIWEGAFSYIKGLKRLVIPESVKQLDGNGIFISCPDLEYLEIKGGLKSIWDMGSFQNCTSLKTVILSEGIETIGGYSFEGCTALTSITLPGSIKTVWDDAFANCTNLKNVYYAGSVTDRSKIEILSGNQSLTSAIWHYNS